MKRFVGLALLLAGGALGQTREVSKLVVDYKTGAINFEVEISRQKGTKTKLLRTDTYKVDLFTQTMQKRGGATVPIPLDFSRHVASDFTGVLQHLELLTEVYETGGAIELLPPKPAEVEKL